MDCTILNDEVSSTTTILSDKRGVKLLVVDIYRIFSSVKVREIRQTGNPGRRPLIIRDET